MLPTGRGCLEFGSSLSQDVAAVVVDASESALGVSGKVLALYNQVRSNLPSGCTHSALYFLGNPERLDPDALEIPGRWAAWWKEKGRKGSFIRPIIETARCSRIEVIAAGPIYDLEDWTGEGAAASVIVHSVETDSGPALEKQLAIHKVDCVEIRGEGFMPYFWDNPQYRLFMEEGNAVLRAEDQEDYAVSLEYFGRDPVAHIRRGHRTDKSDLQKRDQPSDGGKWHPLGPEEITAFNCAIDRRDFSCPACGLRHPAATLICPEPGDSVLMFVYPQMQRRIRVPLAGFIVFNVEPGQVSFRPHRPEAIRVGEDMVALKAGSIARLYRYNPSLRRWEEQGVLTPYHRVADTYVVGCGYG